MSKINNKNIMTKKPVVHHPGEILREEFLIPAQI